MTYMKSFDEYDACLLSRRVELCQGFFISVHPYLFRNTMIVNMRRGRKSDVFYIYAGSRPCGAVYS